MSSLDRNDPLYHPARQLVLHSGEPSVSLIQRRFRIGYCRALALRNAMLGDGLEYCAQTDTWRIAPDADRQTDFLLEHKLAQAAQWLHEAQGLVVAAGAGMGVDSGLPDYRSDNGFWRAYPALARSRLRFEEMATSGQFMQNPERAWGFYGHRLNLYRATVPHAGFQHIKTWGEAMPRGYFVNTSNVDGQFQKAGFAASRIFECHGSIHGLQCMGHCNSDIWSAAHFQPEVDEEQCRLLNPLPRCPACGGLARPNILMFDDWSWNSRHSDEQQARLTAWLEQPSEPQPRGALVVLEIGAGRALPAVRSFTRRMQAKGARVIRINLREANILNPDQIELAMGAREALDRIAQAMP